jgi:hypothetical protein
MRKKHDQKDLEQILRRRGSRQTPTVKPNVTEIRSCGVTGEPEPLPPDNKEGLLGGLLIIWEYCVDFDKVQAFHDFLRLKEGFITEALPKLEEKGSGRYLGTYMLHAGGTPRYRTLWAYSSREAMTKMWRKAQGPIIEDVTQLRQYWLRDPARTEARWLPAKKLVQVDKDLGDAFLRITINAKTTLKT